MFETSKLEYPTTQSDGLKTRDFTIKAGETGHSLTIVQLTDLHIGICNEEDLANDTLAKTYEVRGWSKRAEVTQNALRGLAYADSVKADQIMITGDALDYLSQGGLEWLKKNIWERYPNGKVLVSAGNHELIQRCGWDPVKQEDGSYLDETVSVEDRTNLLESNWGNDLYYNSRVLRDKVMVIQMDNGLNDRPDVAGSHFGQLFHPEQVEKLKSDLELAKEKRYVVLLFFHEAIGTGDPTDKVVNATYIPDSSVHNTQNLYENVAAGTKNDSEASEAIWNLIYENSDNIAAIFAGHVHGDFYSEVSGRTRKIPQLFLTGSIYESGHALKITVEY
ncbi:MAG TPA: hypothetical protein DDW30_07890 [Clostridiales bacterium]|nr:hypothetical protein [Clostridiales bacterium]